jgi:hypothetical protein
MRIFFYDLKDLNAELYFENRCSVNNKKEGAEICYILKLIFYNFIELKLLISLNPLKFRLYYGSLYIIYKVFQSPQRDIIRKHQFFKIFKYFS